MEALKPNDPSHLGDWTLTGRLGDGEDSVIYLGYRGVAGSEQAAIKLIEDDTFEFDSAVSKIRNEVEALKLLNDTNIVKLLDVNYEQGSLWIATEYVHGVTLDTKLKQTKNPLPELEWFKLAENIFHALRAAHAKGVIHKDLKPTNIILSDTGAKLIDFGISHVPQFTRIATPGDFEGSRLFSAPENYNRKNIPEMDVFSAGVTLAYAGKLKSVWAGETQDAITESIKSDAPDLTGLTPLQQEFVRPLLEKLPIDRPSSETAHKKALEYIEYLIDKENRKKPVALRVKKSLTRRLNHPKYKYGIPSTLIGVLALFIASPWSTHEAAVKSSPTITPNSSISPTPGNSSKPVPTATSSTNRQSTSRDCEAEFNNKGAGVLKACLPAAKTGDLSSIYYVGRSYFDNQNYKEAEKWFLIGAQKKDINSMRFLIETYTQLANTTERDRWTKICADTNFGSSDYAPLKDIAYCKMMQGFILTRSGANKEAIMYLSDAADYGNGDAATWLGLYYRDLNEREKAIKWLTRAAELDNTKGLNALISYADEIGDAALAKKWLLVSANSGNQVNMGVLALTYYFEKDLVSAKKWASKGSSFGDNLSTYVLGAVAYDSGQRTEGKALILKAANKGELMAIRKLGSIYRIDEKNYSEAAIWYEKLAARNDFTGTAIYSSLLVILGKDKESCTYNDKVLELGNQAKKNGTYDATLMDKYMSDAKNTYDTWCSKLYPNG